MRANWACTGSLPRMQERRALPRSHTNSRLLTLIKIGRSSWKRRRMSIARTIKQIRIDAIPPPPRSPGRSVAAARARGREPESSPPVSRYRMLTTHQERKVPSTSISPRSMVMLLANSNGTRSNLNTHSMRQIRPTLGVPRVSN
jgi:hypothetical protein